MGGCLRYGWWSYAKYMARNYPNLCEELRQLQSTSTTANYSGEPRAGSDTSRGTESAALRQLSPVKQKEHDSVEHALEIARGKPGNGRLRTSLVDLVFFRQTHTLEGAAQRLHISYGTAKNYAHDFLCDIARFYGML